jgi:hypothetical protein
MAVKDTEDASEEPKGQLGDAPYLQSKWKFGHQYVY